MNAVDFLSSKSLMMLSLLKRGYVEVEDLNV